MALPKLGTQSQAQQTQQSQPWFKAVLRWRKGIEGRISQLRRAQGLVRGLNHGQPGMERWLGWGVIANNLMVIAQALIHRRHKSSHPALCAFQAFPTETGYNVLIMKSNEGGMKCENGTIGTVTRIILGLVLFGSVFYGHVIKGPFRPLPWVIGLLIFPAIFIIWQYLRARRNPARLEANGPLATVLNVVIFFALYFTYVYAPSINFMSDAVLIFYGLSMLLAALRGYGGCESLAISNWLLKRDDQLGCLVLSPIDDAERKFTLRPRTTKGKG